MNYFLVVMGEIVSDNNSKQEAIKTAKNLYDKGHTGVSIGKRKGNKYTLLPLYFYV